MRKRFYNTTNSDDATYSIAMTPPLLLIFLAFVLCHVSSALLGDPLARRSALSLFSAVIQNQDDPTSQSSTLYDRNKETELLDVAIVGGGPTGLACALALLRASSTSAAPRSSIGIFESDSFEPKGASIRLSNSGWKTLKCIDKGTYKDVRKGSVPVSLVDIRDFSGKNKLPGPVVFVMRRLVRPMLRLLRKGLVRTNTWHDLRLSLKRGVESVGSELGYSSDDLIRTNARLFSVDPASRSDGRVLLTFQDGRKVAASTVLACDGTFSSVRKCLEIFEDENNSEKFRERHALIDEKKTVWRGNVPSIGTRGIATFFIAQKEAKVKVSGVLFPASGKAGGTSLAIIAPTTLSGRAKNTEDARERLKKVLVDCGFAIDAQLMECIDAAETMLEHKIFVRDPVRFPDLWSGYDQIAYFGDALHPLRPTGEGLAMGMEDAWTIGHLLGSSKTGRVTPEVLRSYEKERQDRVNAICMATRENAENFYTKDHKEPSDKPDSVRTALREYPMKLSKLY